MLKAHCKNFLSAGVRSVCNTIFTEASSASPPRPQPAKSRHPAFPPRTEPRRGAPGRLGPAPQARLTQTRELLPGGAGVGVPVVQRVGHEEHPLHLPGEREGRGRWSPAGRGPGPRLALTLLGSSECAAGSGPGTPLRAGWSWRPAAGAVGSPCLPAFAARPAPSCPAARPRGGAELRRLAVRPCHAGLRDLCRHLPAHPRGRRALSLPGNGGGAERPDPRCRKRAAAGSRCPVPSGGLGFVRASVPALAAPRAAAGAGCCRGRGCGLWRGSAGRAGGAALRAGAVLRLFRAPVSPLRKAVRLGLWSACVPVRGQNPSVGATLESPVEADG